MSDADRALLEKFKKLLKITQSIKKVDVAKSLKLSEDELLEKLIEWGESLPFKIEDELIVVDDLDKFLSALDQQFTTWGSQESTKIGKIEAGEINSVKPASLAGVSRKDDDSSIIEDFKNKKHLAEDSVKQGELIKKTEHMSNLLRKSESYLAIHHDEFLFRLINAIALDAELAFAGFDEDWVANKVRVNKEKAANLIHKLLNFKIIKEVQTQDGRKFVVNPKGINDLVPTKSATPVAEKTATIISDMKDYHGTQMVANEWTVMMDLERAKGALDLVALMHSEKERGSKAIPAVHDVQRDTFSFATEYGSVSLGFSAENGHVSKLSLDGYGLSYLPETIGQLNALVFLSLNHNQLTSLPKEIGNLSSLTCLHLSDNKLSDLPGTMGQLISLQQLYLNSNHLSSLPKTMGGLSSLEMLYLNDNQLTCLPDTIIELKSLQTINMTFNFLSSLPKAIENWLKNLRNKGCKVYQ